MNKISLAALLLAFTIIILSLCGMSSEWFEIDFASIGLPLLCSAIISALSVTIVFKCFDKPSEVGKTGKYWTFLFSSSILSAAIGFAISYNTEVGSGDYATVSFIAFIFSALLFLAFTFVGRKSSINLINLPWK